MQGTNIMVTYEDIEKSKTSVCLVFSFCNPVLCYGWPSPWSVRSLSNNGLLLMVGCEILCILLKKTNNIWWVLTCSVWLKLLNWEVIDIEGKHRIKINTQSKIDPCHYNFFGEISSVIFCAMLSYDLFYPWKYSRLTRFLIYTIIQKNNWK